MKKNILAVLLAAALVAPAFAEATAKTEVKKEAKEQCQKGSMEIVGKLGFIVEPVLMETDTNGSYSGDKYGYTQEPAFSLGAEFYYYLMNNFAAGLGVNYVFDSKFNDGWDNKDSLGATNIYVSVKPVLKIKENKFIDKVYFLGQLGYGMTRYEDKMSYSSNKYNENGLYWAIGAGVEKCNIILELVYSVDYFEIKDWYESFTSRRLAINAGYKFSI